MYFNSFSTVILVSFAFWVCSVEPRFVPNQCGLHEYLAECGDTCDTTCENYNETLTCSRECRTQCDCIEGFVRIKSGGLCIPKEKCPSGNSSFECGPYEYIPPGCGDTCGLTCANYQRPDLVCTANCPQDQCDCIENYVREEPGGRCIPKEDCPSIPQGCGPNEYMPQCGDTCDITCANYLDVQWACPLDCRPNQCDCIDGYVRQYPDGPCILKEDCFSKHCGENEFLAECGDTCGTTCANYFDPYRPCTAECTSKCDCNEGYVRIYKDGPCIPKEECQIPMNGTSY